MSNNVKLTPCLEYNLEMVEKILRAQMEQDGIINSIHEGMTVALKLNLVAAMKPETAAVTHPVVVEALCRILKGLGADVVMGDSPGGPYTAGFLRGFYNVCGLNEIATRTGARVNTNFEVSDVSFSEGRIAKNITVTSWLLEADYIINCCKLKTHGMMGMSAAVKNMFGSIPGTMKPEYHFRFPSQSDFADMLLDLQEYWKSKMLYHVVDGIVGMEGNGPTAGTPRKIGVILSGRDPYALDLIGGRIIGLEQPDVLTLSRAYERGLGKKSADDVSMMVFSGISDKTELLGTVENLRPFMISDYHLLDTKADIQFGGNNGLFGRLRSKLFSVFLTSKPKVKESECVGCRKCHDICPAKAITMENNIPVIDRSKCIKCFCCQEFCPKGAMKVHRTAVARMLVK